MKDSVLNLGELVVLAARLGAIEHVRQELAEPRPEREGLVGDEPTGFTDESEPPTLQAFVHQRLANFFSHAVAA
ncbi:MAG TPA: hypothetical protein VGB55_14565 [Tepidisphaeraceae bacterium]|jgi:hypothetical protein